MIISIASGKGGTGKTTVAANLALSLRDMDGVSGQYRVLDCDVEEPNTHLFLQPEMMAQIPVTTFIPAVDAARCSGCGNCVEICRYSALTMVGRQILVFPELCHSCYGCQLVCDEGAIVDDSRILGDIESSMTGGIPLYSGRLRIGEAMAPPLIKAVRGYEKGGALTIIDAPPGTSCPVITAMRGADFILIVTEPTPFGLHDLKLAVEAVKTLGIKAGLVINRADLGDSAVRDYAAEQGLDILLEIPFDRRFAAAYSRGETIVSVMPEWKQKFQQLYEQIVQLVEEK